MTAAKILLVDDEPQVLVALEDVLSEDYTVLAVESAAAALQMMEREDDIAVLLTDQRMPEMTGSELMSRLGPECRTQRILVTGFADISAVVSAINEGKVFAYVTKPWDSDDLRAKVTSAVDHYVLAKKLEREKQLLHDLMDNTPDGIAFRGADGRFQRVNRAFASLLGSDEPASVLGKSVSDFTSVHPEAVRWAEQDSQVVRSGTPLVDTIRVYGSEATRRWVSETVAPISGSRGHVLGLVNVARDVSSRLKMEEELRDNQVRLLEKTQLLNSVLQSMDDGVIVADARGHLTFSNRKAEKLLGRTAAGEHVDSWASVFGLVLPGCDGLPHENDPIWRVLHGHPSAPTELVLERAESDDVILAVRAAPIIGKSEQIDGAVVLLRDVTLQRQLEQQLLQSQKLEALGQLAGGIAHDFGNFLAVVQNYAQLIRIGLPAEHTAQADVSEILDATRRAARLTRQLLVFGRNRLVEPTPTACNPVIEQLQNMLQPLIGRHITLVTRLDEAILPVNVDESQLEQMVMNLAINARDAMPDGGTLTITTRRGPPDAALGDRVELSVEDTGHGMPPDVKSRIFEPFFTTKGPGKGTGLGLATVYGIVRQAGGTVSVESVPGEGTKFTILLPTVDSGRRSATAIGQGQHPGGRGTILLVEDDLALRVATARLLREQGFTVLVADDAEHARALCRRDDPHVDLVLTDVTMSQLSGPALTRELKLINSELRVVFMSGYVGSNPLDANLVGEGGILEKPFTPEQLERRIRRALDGGESVNGS